MLNIKDQASSASGYDTSRRGTVSFAPNSSQQRASSGSGESGSSAIKKWNIPKFPDAWQGTVGKPFFKLLLEWRVTAHKGKSQSQLNDLYSTTVEKFQTALTVSAKKGQTKKSRRSKKSNPKSKDDGNDDSGNDDGSSAGEEMVTRKRIRLQKSRRVITEVNA